MGYSNGWQCTPDSISIPYKEKCRLFATDDVAFSTFRKDSDYTKILEGGDRVIGELSIQRIQLHHDGNMDFIFDNLAKFKENDLYGSPTIHNYDGFGDICPCTIKYIINMLDVKYLLGNYQPKKIVEIGGGFGGLCKILSSVYDFDLYIIIDLPEVIMLCEKYLNHFPEIKDKILCISSESLEQISAIQNIDLFIADSSLAECDNMTQNRYIDLLKKSKYGFIVYNTMAIEVAVNNYNSLLETTKDIFDLEEKQHCGIKFMYLRNKSN